MPRFRTSAVAALALSSALVLLPSTAYADGAPTEGSVSSAAVRACSLRLGLQFRPAA